jgi:catechol 2,3-dioxygenase-like lactoylglutathione lyase family enzyme
VTIAVADAAKAIKFFELLGFRQQHVALIDGGAPARYMGMPEMKAQHITLELVGCAPHFEIQLLQFDPVSAADRGRASRRTAVAVATTTLAFRVDDITAATAHLEANGVTMLSDEMDWHQPTKTALASSRAPKGSPSSWWSG